MRLRARLRVLFVAVMSFTTTSPMGGQRALPDFFVTSAWPGPAGVGRFCVGNKNRIYVTLRRQGGSDFKGPISIWLTTGSLTGTLPAGAMQQIEYVPGASSWLVIFRDVPVAAEWRRLEGAFTVIVNPETKGKRPISESNYNNNSYSMLLKEHTDWSQKCS